jgi:hypothetical protein
MENTRDYSELDQGILDYIKEFPGASPSNSRNLEEICFRILGKRISTAWRLIDRRMQAMKKDGIIQYNKKLRRWQINELP